MAHLPGGFPVLRRVGVRAPPPVNVSVAAVVVVVVVAAAVVVGVVVVVVADVPWVYRDA